MNEKLLCRRFELARAANQPLASMKPALLSHYRACSHCQALHALDTRIITSINADTHVMSHAARSRLRTRIRCELDAAYPSSRSFHWLAYCTTLFACVFVGFVLLNYEWTGSHSDTSGPAVSTDTIVGMSTEMVPREPESAILKERQSVALAPAMTVATLVDAHRSRRAPEGLSALPLPSQLTKLGLPSLLNAEQPLPVADATLYVVDPADIELPPQVLEALADGQLARVHHGLHQIVVSERDDRVYVVVTTPGGVEDVAAR